MELTIFSPSGSSCVIPLDGIDYDLFTVNPAYAESVSKTYSLDIDIPVSLLPPEFPAVFLIPGGFYSTNRLNGYLSEGLSRRECTVVFETHSIRSTFSRSDTISLSIEYADLPVDIMGKRFSDMDLGVWSFDQPLSTWAQSSRETTDGLISFPMIYAPEFFKNNYDEQFLGDTDYINRKRPERRGSASPYLYVYPITLHTDFPDRPDDVELHNDNALIPCIHLLSLLKKLFSTSGYTLDTSLLPDYFSQIYLSTLRYPELPEYPPVDILQSGDNPGTETAPTTPGDDDPPGGRDWIFFEQEINIPAQFSGCTVTVTLDSGTLYPCLDTIGRPERYVPTVYKCIIQNTTGLHMESDTLLTETIEEPLDLDISPLEFKFQYTQTKRVNGYVPIRIQFRGSNVYNSQAYSEQVDPPHVEDLQATISFEFDHNKTYEIFLRPDDYSHYVQIRTVDFLSFDTVADLYTALKNSFGLTLSASPSRKVITVIPASRTPTVHDLQQYSPPSYERSYNENDVDKPQQIVIRSSNPDSPVVVISPLHGVIVYKDTSSYEYALDEHVEETVKETGFFPLRTRRQMAAFSEDGAGDNNIFFAPLWVYKETVTSETYKAVAEIEVDGENITLEPDSLYASQLKYSLNSIFRKEQYTIQAFIPTEKFLQINSPDRLYICDRLFDIIEMQAESSGDGYIVTFTLFG